MSKHPSADPPTVEGRYRAEFERTGFLSQAAAELAPTVRGLSKRHFDLADRACATFQALTMSGVDDPQGTAGSPKVVARLLAFRCASASQGAVLMAERGMDVEARVLVRSVLENALCLGALHDQPEAFMDLLWKDAEASRKARGNFILENDLVPTGSAEKARLEEVIAKIEKVRTLGMREVATLSSFRRLYLMYRVLSNDSSHPSAKSLARYITSSPDESGWTGFNVGPSPPDEVDDTLLQLVQALTAAGVAMTQIIGDPTGNRAIAEISEDLRKLSSSKRPELPSV